MGSSFAMLNPFSSLVSCPLLPQPFLHSFLVHCCHNHFFTCSLHTAATTISSLVSCPLLPQPFLHLFFAHCCNNFFATKAEQGGLLQGFFQARSPGINNNTLFARIKLDLEVKLLQRRTPTWQPIPDLS